MRHATTANIAASMSDHGPIPSKLTPPTMLMTANRVVSPATTPAHPPALCAASRAESSSMISGHAQFAITAEIVAQVDQQVNKIFGCRNKKELAVTLPGSSRFQASPDSASAS
jgi:hypothetical protein